jgi:hypothetical protein
MKGVSLFIGWSVGNAIFQNQFANFDGLKKVWVFAGQHPFLSKFPVLQERLYHTIATHFTGIRTEQGLQFSFPRDLGIPELPGARLLHSGGRFPLRNTFPDGLYQDRNRAALGQILQCLALHIAFAGSPSSNMD